MPTYVTLYKWTEQGVRDIKQAPSRIESSIQHAMELGGKVLGAYITLGEYDMVAVAEWPSDEAAATASMAVCSRGNARTVTMRAFTREEFAAIAGKLP